MLCQSQSFLGVAEETTAPLLDVRTAPHPQDDRSAALVNDANVDIRIVFGWLDEPACSFQDCSITEVTEAGYQQGANRYDDGDPRRGVVSHGGLGVRAEVPLRTAPAIR